MQAVLLFQILINKLWKWKLFDVTFPNPQHIIGKPMFAMKFQPDESSFNSLMRKLLRKNC